MENSTFWIDLLGGAISYYNAGGIRTRCLEAGKGEPLILMHGSGGHAESYIKNVVPLSEHFHVYAIDMVGHGFTDDPPTGGGVPALLDHLMKFMDAVGVRRAHLLGESMGGSVSAWAAIKYPERVNKVVYVCGAGLDLDPQDRELAAAGREAFVRLSQQALSEPTRESVRQRLAWLFLDPEKSITRELLETRYQIYAGRRQRGPARPPGQRSGAQEWQLTRERLLQIKAPFFFLWTDHNPTTPWQVAEKAHRLLTGSRFHLVKNAGHWPQYEQAEEFNRVVIDFLKG